MMMQVSIASEMAFRIGILIVVIITLFSLPISPAQASVEDDCFDRVVETPWNWWKPPSRKWKERNVRILCRGTKNAGAPIACYKRATAVMQSPQRSRDDVFQGAMDLCRGTSLGLLRVFCYRGEIRRGRSHYTAITLCASRP